MEDTVVNVDGKGTQMVEDPIYRPEYENVTRIAQFKADNYTSHGSVHTFVWIYISPIIFALGLCGNILIICVMSRPKLRGSSATIYLPLMAFFDTLVLITGNQATISYYVGPTGHVNKLDPWIFLNYSANISHRPLKPFAMCFYSPV